MPIQKHWWPEIGIKRMINLESKQKLFAKLVGQLLLKAYELGYEVTLSEAWRPKVTAEYYAKRGVGIKNSLHTIRLAIDINLFQNGKYLPDSKDYKQLGEWWESLGSGLGVETCWGGRFKKQDGCHFSISHNGIK